MITEEQRDACVQTALDMQALLLRPDGRVVRVKQTRGRSASWRACMPVLADTQDSSNGYRRVFFGHGATRFTVAAHRVVMGIVTGYAVSSDFTVHHRNSDRRDNRPANLVVCSTAENQQYIDWCRVMGATNHDDAEETAFFVKRALETGQVVPAVAGRFGLRESVVRAIRDGTMWPGV